MQQKKLHRMEEQNVDLDVERDRFKRMATYGQRNLQEIHEIEWKFRHCV